MAEINERASTSVEPILSPTSIIFDEAHRLSDNVFEKVSAFVNGQIQGTIDDYKLLEDMNNVTAQRYADMKQVAATVSDRLSQLNAKYEVLKPFLQQIDEIDASSRKMEEAVRMLENYVTALGNFSSFQIYSVIGALTHTPHDSFLFLPAHLNFYR